MTNPKRPLITFEADPDVYKMLQAAKRSGVKMRILCNESLRANMHRIVKRELNAKQTALEELKDLIP